MSKHCVARAVYDNVAEAPDELSFRQGDFLTVLEQNPAGLQGWWLCSSRGRQGICPANRLRLIPRLYDATGGVGDIFNTAIRNTGNKFKNENQAATKWSVERNINGSNSMSSTHFDPGTANLADYDIPRIINPEKSAILTSDYDVPRQLGTPTPRKIFNFSLQSLSEVSLPWSSSSSSSVRSASSESLSLSSAGGRSAGESSSSRCSLSSLETYDIPKSLKRVEKCSTPEKSSESLSETSLSKRVGVIFDIPPSLGFSERSLKERYRTSLDFNSALETVLRLDRDVSLLTEEFVSFRTEQLGSPADLQLVGVRLRNALQELVDFCAAMKSSVLELRPDRDLVPGIERISSLLQVSNNIVQETTEILDGRRWFREKKLQPGTPDPMDRLLACCQNLPNDVHQVRSFVQNFGHRLFPDESEYVNFKSKRTSDPGTKESEANSLQTLQRNLETLAIQTRTRISSSQLTSLEESNVADYYNSQTEVCFSSLAKAIDVFIISVEQNKSPQIFVDFSKEIILNAHKLLCIGDSVHRSISETHWKSSILQRTNKLCESLHSCVNSIKMAAKEFPKAESMKTMLDSVLRLSQIALELKTGLVQAVKQL